MSDLVWEPTRQSVGQPKRLRKSNCAPC